MTSGDRITVLTASYNDWPSFKALLPLLDESLADQAGSVRVVVVDDGSVAPVPDDLMDGAAGFRVVERVDVLTLRRNLGNQRALSVGIGWLAANTECDWLVVMDCDHEDRPEVIPEMLREARALGGGKIVFAARTQRHDGKLFKAFYGAYKRLYRLLTGMPIAIGNFSVVPGRLLQRLAGVWEIAVHFPAGIMKARLPYAAIGAARGRRAFGQSSMNIVNLVVHGLGGLAVHAEVAAVRVVLGTAAMSAAIVGYLVWVLFEKLFTDLPPLGWTTQVMAVFGGVLLQGSLSALLLLFFAVSMRSQRPVIPFADHAAFIMEVSTLLAAAARDNTALRKPVEAE